MKKLLLVLGSLLVVVLAALVMLPRILDVNRYHDRIQAELQTRFGRPVQLGQMSVGLLPPTFKVQNAVIGEDPKFDSAAPFAQAAELDIELKLQPLLHKKFEIATLRMVRPQVELIRGADGAWNFSTIGTHPEQQAKEQAQTTPPPLDRFQIDDGTLAVTDRERKKPRTEYDHIDLVLKDYAPGKPFEIAAGVHLPGTGKHTVRLDGHGGPVGDTTLVSTPFEGTLQLDRVALSAAQQYLNSPALAGTEASISGKLNFKNEAGKAATNGTVHMENVVTHGRAVGFPIELDYNANDDLAAGVIALSNTQLKAGSSKFVINGTVNEKTTPALAELKLNTQNASLGDVVKVAEAFGVAFSPEMQPAGQLSADLTANGPLNRPALAGTIKTTQLKLKGLDANSVLITLKLAPPGAELLKTLSGRVSVNMNDGVLTGVDMSQKLGEIGKFTGAGKASQGATHISSLTGDFDLKNGVASTNDLKALTDAGTMAATGTISLADQGLNMKATAVLSKSSSQQVGGSAIGGMMTTAMANNNGEIVMPVIVTGTVASPKISPDMSAMAEMRLKGLLPSFSNPGQLTQSVMSGNGVSGALGSLTGKQTPGAAASNQQQKGNTAQDAIGGLEGLFGGKKKPQQ